MRTLLSILIMPLTIAATARIGFAQSGTDLVKTELVADVSAIAPAVPFRVGVRFTIEPRWHIYWMNPGDAGTPTEVKFDLPPGFTVGDVQFPVPKKFTQPGDIVGYGYEKETMLTATITPPNDLAVGQTFTFGVNADWLVCEKVCIPGRQKMTITLPSAAKAEVANSEIFERVHQPFPAEKLSGILVQADPLRLKDGVGATTIRTKGRPLNDVEIFVGPLDDAEVSLGKIDEAASQVSLYVKVLPGQKLKAKSFHVLLAYETPEGRRAYDVTVPIETEDR